LDRKEAAAKREQRLANHRIASAKYRETHKDEIKEKDRIRNDKRKEERKIARDAGEGSSREAGRR
jgi:hypothetical protein